MKMWRVVDYGVESCGLWCVHPGLHKRGFISSHGSVENCGLWCLGPVLHKRLLLVRSHNHDNQGSVGSHGSWCNFYSHTSLEANTSVLPKNFTSIDHGGTRTHNLSLRRRAPYPLGHMTMFIQVQAYLNPHNQLLRGDCLSK